MSYLFPYKWCYKGPLRQEKTTQEVIEELSEIITAIEMKMLKNKHSQEEHLRKALLLYKQNETKEEIMSEMRKKHTKKKQYMKWMYILEQVEKIHGEIDNTMGLEDVINSFKKADNILQLALQKINKDDVESIMDNMSEHILELKEINDVLSDNSKFYIDDYTEEIVINEIKEQIKEDEMVQFIAIPSSLNTNNKKVPVFN